MTDHKTNSLLNNPPVFGLSAFLLLLLLTLVPGCSQGKPKALKVGGKVPVFSTTDIEGKTVSLADSQGAPVILRFWSTECKYCRADTPIFNKFFQRYRENGLRIMYINTEESEDQVRAFVNKLDIPFTVIRDSDRRIAASYNVKIQPITMFISPQMTLLAALLGGVSEAEIQDIIGPYLPDKE